MRKSKIFWIGVLAGFFVMTLGLSGTAVAEKPIMIGWQSDYAKLVTIGPVMAQGFKDYIKVFKSEGGTVEGHPVDFMECTHDYDVNRGLECYQRHKMAGIVSLALYGTPHTYALTPKLTADKIPAICAGFGRADAMDGTRFPYIFPVAATYWSQATAAIKYIQDAEGKENLKGVKIAYLYFDNPAGKEPMEVFRKLEKKFGFKMRMFGVPSPGVEMGAQVTDITRRFKADWVIGHMFGRAPSVSLKELYRKGFPLDHYIGFVWNTFDTDVAAAGKDISKGCLTISYTGMGTDFPLHKKIKALYEKEGKSVPEYFNSTGYYNRGLYWAGIQVEAVRQAIKHYGTPVTGATVAKGYEKISGFTMGGLFPPMELSKNDHEGGGWVIIYQWDGKKFVLKRNWFKAHRDIIKAHLTEVIARMDKK
jgi:branched-chain amino acid transport system substrate-binding protein